MTQEPSTQGPTSYQRHSSCTYQVCAPISVHSLNNSSVAGGLILFESIRSKRKEAAKQESIVDDIAALQDEIEWLKKQLKQSQVLHGEYRLPDHVKPTIIKINSEGAEAMDAGHPSMGATPKPPIDVSASDKQGPTNRTA